MTFEDVIAFGFQFALGAAIVVPWSVGVGVLIFFAHDRWRRG